MAAPSPIRSHWALPSLADILLICVLAWLLLSTTPGGLNMLPDAGLGVHIRTGEWIVENGFVPQKDLYSFSKPDAQWFAWEWLSDLIFAYLFRAGGLPAVVMICVIAICLSIAICLRHMLLRGAETWTALLLLGLVLGTSSVHYLARPHVFTILLFALSWYWIDADRLTPSRRIWLLIPLTALWVNLHGGFAGLLITLGVLAAGALLARDRARFQKYVLLLAGCLAASLANPYGWRLHLHVWRFLQAGWLLDLVKEFGPPSLRSETGPYFEVLLFLGVAQGVNLLRQRRFGEGLLVLLWAHAALTSLRHLPLFALVAAPMAAESLLGIWRKLPILAGIGDDFRPALARHSLLVLAGPVLIWRFATLAPDFPTGEFPAALASEQSEILQSSRLLTTDRWADYLAYRLSPKQKIFLDGRSDFFGPQIISDYQTMLYGERGWRANLEKHRIDGVLLAPGTPLLELLSRDAGWTRVTASKQAELWKLAVTPLARVDPAVSTTR